MYNYSMKKVGEFIKARRLSKGLSMNALAKKAGVAQTTVAYLESGKHDPSFGILRRILKALSVSWPDFLEAIGFIKKGNEETVYDVEPTAEFKKVQEEIEKYCPGKK
jgi:transcriptional regulator with XRE-family HTH domain